MEQLAYFVFNKKKDYESGYGTGIQMTDQGLALKEDAPKMVFLFRAC